MNKNMKTYHKVKITLIFALSYKLKPLSCKLKPLSRKLKPLSRKLKPLSCE